MNNGSKEVFEHNKEILTSHVDIHPDDVETLDISINELIDEGVGMIKEISFEEDNAYNWVMLLTNDENQVYYLELSEHGSVVLLKKDGLEGEEILSFQCGISV
jgi:hypothetical protein